MVFKPVSLDFNVVRRATHRPAALAVGLEHLAEALQRAPKQRAIVAEDDPRADIRGAPREGGVQGKGVHAKGAQKQWGEALVEHTAVEPRLHQPHPHIVPLHSTVANRIGACKAEGQDNIHRQRPKKNFSPLLHPPARVLGSQPVETAAQNVAKGIGLVPVGQTQGTVETSPVRDAPAGKHSTELRAQLPTIGIGGGGGGSLPTPPGPETYGRSTRSQGDASRPPAQSSYCSPRGSPGASCGGRGAGRWTASGTLHLQTTLLARHTETPTPPHRGCAPLTPAAHSRRWPRMKAAGLQS